MFCLIISWAISHLGRNPVRGGSPLRDRRDSIESATREGALDQVIDNSYMFFVLRVIRARNSVAVIMT